MGSAARASFGTILALALCPAMLADSAPYIRWCCHLRRLDRSSGLAHELGRCPAVDSLARPGHSRPAGPGQLLLHGLSVLAAANSGQTILTAALHLAQMSPQQMAGSFVARPVPVGLRGFRSLGQ